MALALEDFEGSSFGDIQETPTPRSYEEGLADGLAQALEAQAAKEVAALEQSAQCLSDIEISYGEARQAVLEALNPFFTAISEVLLPSLQCDALRAQLVSYLDGVATRDTEAIALQLAPDDARSLAPHLAHNLDLALMNDPTLRPGQAVLSVGAQETFFNVDEARAQITDLLNAIVSPQGRTEHHG